MKEKLKKEIEEMIERNTEYLVTTEGMYTRHTDRFTHTKVLELILQHLKIEPDIKCRHPETILISTAKEKK